MKILQPTIYFARSLFPLRIQFRQLTARPRTSNTCSGTISSGDGAEDEHADEHESEDDKSSSTSTSTGAVVMAQEEGGGNVDDYDATAEYDLIAVKHGWLCLFPLVLGLPIYYLKFYKYKSW